MNKNNTKLINKIIDSKSNFFITGKAGTGKTTFTKLFIEELTKLNIYNVVLSPTGVAALNVGGVTIHSFFKFAPKLVVQDAGKMGEDEILNPKYKNLKYIIIDEISMVRADLLDCIDIFLRKVCQSNKTFAGIQMIFVGDLYQLSPIVTKKEYDFNKKYPSSYFFSSDVFLRNNFRLELYELKKIYRQTDSELISILNNVRLGKISIDELIKLNQAKYHKLTNKHITLTTTNRDQLNINSKKLKKLNGIEYIYEMVLDGKVDYEDTTLEQVLHLKKGARIMFLQNSIDKIYVNGTLGTIISIDEFELGIITDEGNNIIINKKSGTETIYEYVYDYSKKIIKKRVRGNIYQLPIKLAWAITIHKSQGVTYENVSIDFGIRGCFAEGQAYVALSRCKTFKGLHLQRPVDISSIKANKFIKNFLNNNIDSNNQLNYNEMGLELSDYEKEIFFAEKGGINYFNVAKSIIKKINIEGGKAFIVGGFCRNRINNTTYNTDIDISTDFIPTNIEKYFNVVNDIGKNYGVLVIKEYGYIYEITTFRQDINIKSVLFNNKFKEDANRRDFTINAIYLDPLRDVYQIFNNIVGKTEYIPGNSLFNFIKDNRQDGINDLKNNIIRFIGTPLDRIKKDPLRLLRYVRFKYGLGLKDYKSSQYNIIKENFELIKTIPFERIKIELEKIFISYGVVDAISCLKDLGFFKLFIPEIDNLDKCSGGPKYHLEGNVWTHVLLIIKELNKKGIIDPDMYWLALFHDIGKPKTFTKKEDGNISYIGHEELSYEIFNNYVKKLKFSNKQVDKIGWIIKNHLLFGRIIEMKKLKSRKLFLNKHWNSFYTFCSADCLGRLPIQTKMVENINKMYNDFIEKYEQSKLLTGEDIKQKYPKLTGIDIGNKLEEINNKIIIDI